MSIRDRSGRRMRLWHGLLLGGLLGAAHALVSDAARLDERARIDHLPRIILVSVSD